MLADQIFTGVGLIGLGGLLKSAFYFLIAARKAKAESRQSFKEVRYKAIILLCYSLVYYHREKTTLVVNRPDITSLDHLLNELHAELINTSLFASDSVIVAFKKFVSSRKAWN